MEPMTRTSVRAWSPRVPPETVRAFFQGTEYNRTVASFFGPPFMVARNAPLVAALIAGWHLPRHRRALLLAVACFLGLGVGVLGATGYTGRELIQLLTRHPRLELGFATSESEAGQPLQRAFSRAPHAACRAGPCPVTGRQRAFIAASSHARSMRPSPRIEPATLGNLAGIVGAAYLAMDDNMSRQA